MSTLDRVEAIRQQGKAPAAGHAPEYIRAINEQQAPVAAETAHEIKAAYEAAGRTPPSNAKGIKDDVL